jgi:hypothetical protein
MRRLVTFFILVSIFIIQLHGVLGFHDNDNSTNDNCAICAMLAKHVPIIIHSTTLIAPNTINVDVQIYPEKVPVTKFYAFSFNSRAPPATAII